MMTQGDQDRLDTLIRDTAACVDEMRQAHEALTEALRASDDAGVESINATLSAANERLSALDRARDELVAGSGKSSMSALLAESPNAPALTERWEAVLKTIRSMLDPMRRNQRVLGMVAEKMNQQLVLLRGEEVTQATTYSASGGGLQKPPQSSRHLGDA